jgi:hypothetical protein
MNEEERLKLRRPVAAWSDGRGLAQATALADQHRYLLPKRITNAQLSGLNGVVQAATDLGQVTAFAQHQGERAARAGRLDVKGYWDALRQALEALEGEAGNLAAQAGMTLVPPSGKGKARPKAPEWLTLWLAQEFVQHLVAHSLYLGATGK